MRKHEINVPKNLGYFSDWKDFTSHLPSGKVIIDKGICGCGMTHFFLSNPDPVVLVSPRIGLINSKMNDPYLSNLFYFDRSEKDSSITINHLDQYLSASCMGYRYVPKTLVTYDSLPHVIHYLSCQQLIDKFSFVIDEFSCIFTDARMKGLVEMRLLNELVKLPNRCAFISATPIHEAYLDELDEFKNLDYVTLKWDDSRKMPVKINRIPMKSTKDAICVIINQYKKTGYFQSQIVNGQLIYSREAVFYVNSIKEIKAVIKATGLTPEQTRIICGNNDDNAKKFKDKKNLGSEFIISDFPDRNSYQTENKPITFVTSTAFEGSDHYSDDASIYVFADSNQDNLSLDISIDLPQIVGRCRTVGNPFRYIINYYYRTTRKDDFDLDNAIRLVEDRNSKTLGIYQKYHSTEDPDLLDKFESAQVNEKYSKDYIDVLKDSAGKRSIIYNKLVYLADLRAIDIKFNQYKDRDSLMLYLAYNNFDVQNISDTEGPYQTFFSSLLAITSFEKRLKCCFEEIEKDPCLLIYILNNPDLSFDLKECLTKLSHDECRSVSYKRVDLLRLLNFRDSKGEIKSELSKCLIPDTKYTKKEIKDKIQEVYDAMSLGKCAKATDIKEFFDNVKNVTLIDSDGKKQKGFKIQRL